MSAAHIRVYDSLSSEYELAFSTFLKHTDQNEQARYWLDQIVRRLARKQVFIDAGAGAGMVTSWYADQFERTIAIEPNLNFHRRLKANCPRATVLAEPILQANPDAAADFVLASHVLYYIPATAWEAHLDRLASFVAPGGALVVILQSPGSDCMRLVERFHRTRFDLKGLGDEFVKRNSRQFSAQVISVDSYIQTSDSSTAYTIAEFMLNLLPVRTPPMRCELEDFIDNEFTDDQGGYRFSCSQDFLVVRRNAD